MHYLNYFYQNTLKLDLINKFYYTNLKNLPKLKKVTLNASCKTTDLKILATHFLALELIANQKGILTISKRPNLLLKIRKGNPVGCKLILKKSLIFNFFSKIIQEIFPNIKNFTGIILQPKKEKTDFSFIIKDTLLFSQLSENYSLFSKLSNINICFITNVKTRKEMVFILKALKLPLK